MTLLANPDIDSRHRTRNIKLFVCIVYLMKDLIGLRNLNALLTFIVFFMQHCIVNFDLLQRALFERFIKNQVKLKLKEEYIDEVAGVVIYVFYNLLLDTCCAFSYCINSVCLCAIPPSLYV